MTPRPRRITSPRLNPSPGRRLPRDQRQLPEHGGAVLARGAGSMAALVVALDAVEPRRPLVVKLSPDQPVHRLRLIVDVESTPAAGLILSNTSRCGMACNTAPGRRRPGWAVRPPADARHAGRHRHGEGRCRGSVHADRVRRIFSGDDARRARDAGADLVQLWTGMACRAGADRRGGRGATICGNLARGAGRTRRFRPGIRT